MVNSRSIPSQFQEGLGGITRLRTVRTRPPQLRSMHEKILLISTISTTYINVNYIFIICKLYKSTLKLMTICSYSEFDVTNLSFIQSSSSFKGWWSSLPLLTAVTTISVPRTSIFTVIGQGIPFSGGGKSFIIILPAK